MISAGMPRLRVSIVHAPAEARDGQMQSMREVLVHGREAGGRAHHRLWPWQVMAVELLVGHRTRQRSSCDVLPARTCS